MKKLIAVSIVLALLVPAVFAEVTVSAGVHGVFVPLEVEINENGDDNISAGEIIGWGTGHPRAAQITFAGETEDGKVGFKSQININELDNNGVPFSLDDWAGVWIKPIDQIKLTFGRYQVDDLRSSFGGTGDFKLAIHNTKEEDAIFNRFTGTVGALLQIYPVEALGIHLNFDGFGNTRYAFGSDLDAAPNPNDYPGNTSDPDYQDDLDTYNANKATITKAWRIYEKFQLALSYDIAGIGLFRVQFLNASIGTDGLWPAPSDNKNATGGKGRLIQAAFKVTAIENVSLDIGGKIPLRYLTAYGATSDTYAKDPYAVSVAADVKLGSLGIWGRVDTEFGGYDSYWKVDSSNYQYSGRKPVTVIFHVQPSYDLGAFVLGADFGMSIETGYWPTKQSTGGTKSTGFKSPGNVTASGIGGWLKLPIGGGYLKGGLAYKIGDDEKTGNNSIFSIPIAFDYSF